MKPYWLLVLVCAFTCRWAPAAEKIYQFKASTNDVVFADFEGDDWGKWTVTGTAFGSGPAHGTLPNQQAVSGFEGRGFVCSYHGADAATGTLTSPEFTITLPYLNFLIGGGNHPGEASINLIIDGKVAYSATGAEFERLRWHTWQLYPVMRKQAHLEIVDKHTGGWGHLQVDQITFTQRPRVVPYANDAVTTAMASVADGVPTAEADPTRPIYHFLAPAFWMNDPNGPIYFHNYYHLYYQFNPFGDRWGHMHWGHARSRDLVTWKYLPISLWPSKELGEDHVFSGCTTTNSQGAFLAFYTSIGRGKSASDNAEQWIALGDSEGNTFIKYTNNPVLSEKLHGSTKVYDWRDPFLFRHEGTAYLVCGGNLNQAKGGQAVVLLYEAANGELTDWKYRGVLFTHPDASVKNIECPNFFRLGDRWVLVVSPHGKVEYFTGNFDPAAGKFTASQRGLMDYSDNYYAPNCMEDPQGRRIMWGWIRGFKDGRGWNGCHTLPRVLTVDAAGLIQQAPVSELAKLRTQAFNLSGPEIRNATNDLENVQSDSLELAAEIEVVDAKQFGFRLRTSPDGQRSVLLRQDGDNLEVAGAKAKVPLGSSRQLKLRAFLDKSVLEVYANGVCVTRVLDAPEKDLGLSIFASGGAIRIKTLEIWPLKTIW
jgi:beta-fructofuranosidase